MPSLNQFKRKEFKRPQKKTVKISTEKATEPVKQPVKAVLKTAVKTSSKAASIKFSIGAQLITIISIIVTVSLILITVLVSYFISEDTRVKAEENNLTINSRTASDTESRFNSIISSAGMLYDAFSEDEESESLQNKAFHFFERNSDIIAIKLVDEDHQFVNNQYFISRELDSILVAAYAEQESDYIDAVENGEVSILNATPFFDNQIVAVFTPVRSEDDEDIAMILASMEALSDNYSTGSTNLSFMVNKDGTLIVHPDLDLMNEATDFKNHYLVKTLNDSTNSNEQITYSNADGVEYIGAYTKLNIGACAVITEVQTKIVFEAVTATTRRNIYLDTEGQQP